MFAQLNVYKNLIIGGIIIALLLGLYFYIHSLKVQISDLQGTLKDTYVELANEKLQSTRYKSALDSQSKEIEALKHNEALAIAKLKKWQSRPPEVRYKTITKIREVKSDDCKDIKNALDAVRSIDYNSL
jgi:hypothetical protein